MAQTKNFNFHQAKKAKNDEFYTRYEDIEKEIVNYKDELKGKYIYCNCDNDWSNFWKFFCDNFHTYGLKHLTATGLDGYRLDYDGKTITKKQLIDDTLLGTDVGDCFSSVCIELLKESDIVVTNPPFSLFRDYVAQLMEYDKKFLIIGSINAITYKEIFPLIKDNKMWLGNKNGAFSFKVPDYYEARETRIWVDDTGQKWRSLGNICWFTNLNYPKRQEDLILYRSYSPEDYPKYDNYDAINVDKVSEIPKDYYGVMGVPITFLYKYNPEQFEIVEFRKGEDGKDLVFTQKKKESSTLLSYPHTTSIPGMIKSAEGKINGKPTYARITIRRKLNL